MLAAQITLPHFSVSSAIKFPNYIGPWCAGVRPRYFARSPDANASGRRAGQRNRRRGRTSGVAARLIETSDDALLDRIAASDEHDRDRQCCRLGRKYRSGAAGRSDDRMRATTSGPGKPPP
jgi:hypothetical protein